MKPETKAVGRFAYHSGCPAMTGESEAEHFARLLMVLERQRRISERLAAFERDMLVRAARAEDEISD